MLRCILVCLTAIKRVYGDSGVLQALSAGPVSANPLYLSLCRPHDIDTASLLMSAAEGSVKALFQAKDSDEAASHTFQTALHLFVPVLLGIISLGLDRDIEGTAGETTWIANISRYPLLKNLAQTRLRDVPEARVGAGPTVGVRLSALEAHILSLACGEEPGLDGGDSAAGGKGAYPEASHPLFYAMPHLLGMALPVCGRSAVSLSHALLTPSQAAPLLAHVAGGAGGQCLAERETPQGEGYSGPGSRELCLACLSGDAAWATLLLDCGCPRDSVLTLTQADMGSDLEPEAGLGPEVAGCAGMTADQCAGYGHTGGHRACARALRRYTERERERERAGRKESS
ncbi:hypothetical protein KIPB_006551 [Kipferlia bialata]|uniref:Uncharacterized protein n=1 Tax=Kipferlia bialata TaxID=797122 RepID=A0A391NWR9_9EUKA|nr:hypothetical protein KIPB_006551 [Kipferlia bialata]|eukprot:g6551.t1